MRSFPQEIVDLVIDRLTDYEFPRKDVKISQYSTVSWQWVARTQKHHFKSVHFNDQSELEKWCTAIDPDPAGVSRHVRELSLERINTLEGFGAHIRAFTSVETARFDMCGILRSPSIVETLAPMRSTLVRLEISQVSTTISIITSLLAALPHLRHLLVCFLNVLGDRDVIVPPRIPFFEDADSLDLMVGDDVHGQLGWIPTSARIRDLRLDPTSIQDKSGRVQELIASSAESLKFLSITAVLGGAFLNPFS